MTLKIPRTSADATLRASTSQTPEERPASSPHFNQLPAEVVEVVAQQMDPSSRRNAHIANKALRDSIRTGFRKITVTGPDLAEAFQRYPNADAVKIKLQTAATPDVPPLAPEHLHALVQAAPRIRELDISGLALTPAHVEHITRLPQLTKLVAKDCMNVDGHLKDIAKLARLTHLDLRIEETDPWAPENLLTDEGLRHLGRLTELQSLSLSDRQASDAGDNQFGTFLEHWQSLGRLSELYLRAFEDLSEAKLAHLGQLTGLTQLDLSCQYKIGAGHSDGACFQSWARLTQLKRLNLEECVCLNDEAIDRLASALPGLTALDISASGAETPFEITVDSLQKLGGMAHLKQLDVAGIPGIGDLTPQEIRPHFTQPGLTIRINQGPFTLQAPTHENR